MSNPYTSVTVNNYNSNPPSDDGAQTPDNEVTWSKHKTKLGDPLKTAIESINTNASTAFGKVAGGVTSVSTDYTVLAGDQGKLIVQTGDSKTITMIAPGTAGSPFRVSIVNRSAGSTNLTVTRSSAETINGAASITVLPNYGVTLDCDGTNWIAGNHIPIGFGGLTDPDADRIAFWDDSAGKIQWLTIGSGLALTDTTITSPLKTWGKATTAGVVTASLGVTSVTDNGAGDITWTWATAFSNADYVGLGTSFHAAGSAARSVTITAQTTTTLRAHTIDAGGSKADPDTAHFISGLGNH